VGLERCRERVDGGGPILRVRVFENREKSGLCGRVELADAVQAGHGPIDGLVE
jgi:hypothetical protein